MRMTRSCIGLLTALLALTLSHSPVQACMAIGRMGPVQVKGEEALIVWDAAHQTQHFYRQAHFEGAPEEFGFLVPTPTQPELGEVRTPMFRQLYELYRRPEPVARSSDGIGGMDGRLRARSAGAAPRVEVLEQRVVAGMEASVLRANEAGVLDRWLTEHGYPSGPSVTAYFAPYVTAGWIITAFRIAPGAQQGAFATSIVRMSFHTEHPFFPYSEAAGASTTHRPFRVSIISQDRMRAFQQAPGGTGAHTDWYGAAYAGRPRNLATRVRGLPRGSVPRNAWLTTFHEPRSQRGALDLFFEVDPEQTPLSSTISTQLIPN